LIANTIAILAFGKGEANSDCMQSTIMIVIAIRIAYDCNYFSDYITLLVTFSPTWIG
jgi:hypothetical protein